MLYAILCYNSEAVLEDLPADEHRAMMDGIADAMHELGAQGKLGPVARLSGTAEAVTLRPGDEPVVIDGPFAETKEQLLGFWIVRCETREEAVEAARLLARQRPTGALEIRPITEFRPDPA
jgi:hypothetical protein